MPNPTKGWDKVPVFGWYMELDGVTPKVGTVKLTLAQRVTSTDGRTIFPGGTITATLGGTDNDTAVLNQIRAAMSAVDQAAVEAGGGTFDAAAWGADWDARLPGAFFTSFPASDDPDIVEDGFQVKVEEKLASGDGKIYYITPLLADLSNPIPGVNLGTIAVPPGAPTAPAPIYQKGQPGGVASLDDTGVVPLAQIPSGISASASVDTLTGATDVGKSLMKATDAAAARAATGAGTSSLVVGTTAGTAADAAATTAALGLKADAAATTTALGLKLDWRGDYVDGGVYAVNDVVNSPGNGSYKCLQAHTASGPAPDIESPFWHLLGSAVVIGSNTGQAADGGATAAALGAKLDDGYAGAVPGTTFTVLWVAGTGWPARPTARTDVFVHWVDITGESTDTDTPTDIVTGDRVIRIDTGTGGTSAITVRSVTSAAPVGAVDYQAAPIPLAGPAGLAIADYYLVAACFGSLPYGSDFIVPAGFTRLTPSGGVGQDFAVFGRPIGTSADVAACASTNWSPNTHTATRGLVVGVALEGVASVGTATAITYDNPISSPYTLAAASGDATFQVIYTGEGSTSTHTTHASVGGTLLVQAIAKSASTDPTADTVLSISMNGTGVTLTPGATYGGATNIPMTKA